MMRPEVMMSPGASGRQMEGAITSSPRIFPAHCPTIELPFWNRARRCGYLRRAESRPQRYSPHARSPDLSGTDKQESPEQRAVRNADLHTREVQT